MNKKIKSQACKEGQRSRQRNSNNPQYLPLWNESDPIAHSVIPQNCQQRQQAQPKDNVYERHSRRALGDKI